MNRDDLTTTQELLAVIIAGELAFAWGSFFAWLLS